MTFPLFAPVFDPPANPPKPNKDWALFLDLDGTLIDIADTPDSVVVPPDLPPSLIAARQALGGALAIVSGRRSSNIDRLLSPALLPLAAEHGAVFRLADGASFEIDASVPKSWAQRLAEFATGKPGVLVEPKGHSVAVHYRKAPQHAAAAKAIASELAAAGGDEFEVLEGKMVYELRAKAHNKGRAIEFLMTQQPFKGRVPVFAGDDVTDEDGFRAVEALGGLALRVWREFRGRPQDVRNWLEELPRQLGHARLPD